jgi:hypothetical protein
VDSTPVKRSLARRRVPLTRWPKRDTHRGNQLARSLAARHATFTESTRCADATSPGR